MVVLSRQQSIKYKTPSRKRMTLHIYDNNDIAVVLVGIKNHRNIYHFPSTNSVLPGLHFAIQQRVPINEQIIARIKKETNLENIHLKIDVKQGFKEELHYQEKKISLYLATLTTKENLEPKTNWQTIPTLLKQMPKNKTRAAYLKAWQVLSESTLQ